MTVINAIDTLATSGQATRLFGSGNINNDLLIGALIVVMAVMLAAAIVIQKAMRVLLRVAVPGLEAEEQAEKAAAKVLKKEKRQERWQKLLGLRPVSEEKDLLIEHEYDGIAELDNPVPAWFMGLFYATITFACVYLLVYHVFNWGMNQQQEYQAEMAHADEERKIYLAHAANNVDENNVALDQQAATLAAGKAIFTQNCVACHGDAAQGIIGPNLTDDYWLHGGDIQHIFKTVKYGVPDKGMVSWEQSLTPAQIAQVCNYVISLRGSQPPNPKAPQGELEKPGSEKPGINSKTDSLTVLLVLKK